MLAHVIHASSVLQMRSLLFWDVIQR